MEYKSRRAVMLRKDLRNKVLYSVAIVLVSFVALGVFWLSVSKKSKTQDSSIRIIRTESSRESQSEERAEIVIKDLILKEVERHKGLEVVVNASEGKILNSTDKIECKNIACALNNNHRQIANLRANNAIIHKKTKNVFLSGATVGHTCDVTIVGQDISYNYSSQTLNTSKETSYQHQFFSLHSQKSSVDLKNSKISMCGGVASEFSNGSASNHDAD